jgi:hypothetical protein
LKPDGSKTMLKISQSSIVEVEKPERENAGALNAKAL